MPKQTVWVVMHYEIMGLPEWPRVDSVQFHVASTRRRAENYLRRSRACAHSWWQVHPHVVDCTEGGEGGEVYYYSHRATPLKCAPTRRAIKAFRKHADRHPQWYASPRPYEE
jgi:hypothetical protein